jgi:hypothetical protein
LKVVQPITPNPGEICRVSRLSVFCHSSLHVPFTPPAVMSFGIANANALPDLWEQLFSHTRPVPPQNGNYAEVSSASDNASKGLTSVASLQTAEHLALWTRNISLQQAGLQDTMRKCLNILQDEQESVRQLQEVLTSIGETQARLEISGNQDGLKGVVLVIAQKS